VNCWLVSTGWTGGAHGVGHRMPIKATRALLNAALDGSLNDAEFREDETFGFMVPAALDGVDSTILNPRDTWSDKSAYDAQAEKLAKMFVENFKVYEAHVDADVNAAGPRVRVPA
jgi:phosphoenolpyruvate carboxykinase (ATP)